MKKKIANDSYIWGMLRISLGFIFLWAFLDKFFGLGFSTCREKSGEVIYGCSAAVIEGGSATAGFLNNATSGPLSSFYQNIAGNTLIDVLFLFGLAGIGIALLLGIFIRIASIGGVILMLLMWSAVLPPSNNPVLDEHIIYALVFIGILRTHTSQTWGFGARWSKTQLVTRYRWLQ